MADIRINQLPNEAAPSGTDYLAIDGATTRRTTITLATLAGRPSASQAEAEAGTDPTKAMTPLTTKQAITFYGPTLFQPLSTKLTNLDGTSLSAGGMLFGAGVDTWSVLPLGSNNQFLTISGGNPTWVNAAAGGDVTGPASSVTGSIPTFNGATGKIIQAGNPTMADFLSAARGPMSTIANDTTDAVNDIVFSAGSAFSSDATHWPMVGGSQLIKQLDAAWAVGNSAGGRMSAAAIANTTYFCYQIRRPDTGVVDYGFDVSPTAPTLPTNYTQYRRIGAILRESNAIVLFDQSADGQTFIRRTNATTRSSTAAAASALLTFQVPIGIPVQPIVISTILASASVTCSHVLGSASAGAATQQINAVITGVGGQEQNNGNPPPIWTTNNSGQLYFAQLNSAGTPASTTLVTAGWVDPRGR